MRLIPYWIRTLLRREQKSNEEWVRQWEQEIARNNHARANNIAIILSQRKGNSWSNESVVKSLSPKVITKPAPTPIPKEEPTVTESTDNPESRQATTDELLTMITQLIETHKT